MPGHLKPATIEPGRGPVFIEHLTLADEGSELAVYLWHSIYTVNALARSAISAAERWSPVSPVA